MSDASKLRRKARGGGLSTHEHGARDGIGRVFRANLPFTFPARPLHGPAAGPMPSPSKDTPGHAGTLDFVGHLDWRILP